MKHVHICEGIDIFFRNHRCKLIPVLIVRTAIAIREANLFFGKLFLNGLMLLFKLIIRNGRCRSIIMFKEGICLNSIQFIMDGLIVVNTVNSSAFDFSSATSRSRSSLCGVFVFASKSIFSSRFTKDLCIHSHPRGVRCILFSSQSRYPDFEGKRRKLTDNARVCKPLKNQHFSALEG